MEFKQVLFIALVGFWATISPGLWGVLGSAGFYITEVSYNPKDFKWGTFFMYCFVGFVAATMFAHLPTASLGWIDEVAHSPGFLIATGLGVRRLTEVANNILDLGLKLPTKQIKKNGGTNNN